MGGKTLTYDQIYDIGKACQYIDIVNFEIYERIFGQKTNGSPKVSQNTAMELSKKEMLELAHTCWKNLNQACAILHKLFPSHYITNSDPYKSKVLKFLKTYDLPKMKNRKKKYEASAIQVSKRNILYRTPNMKEDRIA